MAGRLIFSRCSGRTPCIASGLTPRQPVDFSLLDPHFGTIEDWRTVIDEIHRRGMYIVLDNTMAT